MGYIMSFNGSVLSPSNKNNLHSKLELPNHKIFQLPIPSSGILKNLKNLFQLSSTGDKKISKQRSNLSIKVNSSLARAITRVTSEQIFLNHI